MNSKKQNWEQKAMKQPNVKEVSMDLIPLDEILAKGTIFRELYEPYKIIPRGPVAENEQEQLLHEIQTYGVAQIDLNLYLDVNPQDSDAITLFNMIRERRNEAIRNYEQKYGPLNIKSDALKGFPWTWILSAWPWEGSGQ